MFPRGKIRRYHRDGVAIFPGAMGPSGLPHYLLPRLLIFLLYWQINSCLCPAQKDVAQKGPGYLWFVQCYILGAWNTEGAQSIFGKWMKQVSDRAGIKAESSTGVSESSPWEGAIALNVCLSEEGQKGRWGGLENSKAWAGTQVHQEVRGMVGWHGKRLAGAR